MPTKKSPSPSLIPIEQIARSMYLIRGEKVMLDSDLAALYGVETRVLNQSVARNIERFPSEFAFQLSQDEFDSLMSQIVISNSGQGGRRKLPWVFTEHGVAMLSSVLRSKRAIQINISIIKTFVRMREVLATHKDLAQKVEKHDKEIAALYEYLQKLLEPPKSSKRKSGTFKNERPLPLLL